MRIASKLRTTARGPVREALRAWQARNPRLAAGEVGPPHFVGIGAQRCGTSWWHSLIEQHPRVASLGWGAKELHYFDESWRSDRPAVDYAAHFRRRPGQVTGEWTPRYMFDPWAVPALLGAAPEVKLLVMLRDPVARFHSGVRHAAKHRGASVVDDVTEAFSRGLYAEQLGPVTDLVGPEQLLVLQFEQCVREPDRMLRATCDFLGLEPQRLAGPGERNQAVAPPVAISAPALSAVRDRYRADAARLFDLFPDAIDPELWTGLGQDRSATASGTP